MRETSRLNGIELLRFLCAISIVLWHYQHFFCVTDVTGPHIHGYLPERLPGYAVFSVPYTLGSYAVQMFWIISGFIFFWKYADAINTRAVTMWQFFVFRFTRLYPLHLLTLGLVALLQYLFWSAHGYYAVYPVIDLYHLALNLFMASGWGLDRGYSFNAPIWSVSAEEIIYAAFFLLASRFPLGIFRPLVLSAGCWVLMKVVQRTGTEVGILVLMCGCYYFLGGAIERIWAALPLSLTSRDFFGWAGNVPSILGNLTYSSYLLHFPVMLIFLLVTESFGFSREIYFDWRVWLGYVLVVFIAARFVYVWVERPVQGYLRTLLLRSRFSVERA